MVIAHVIDSMDVGGAEAVVAALCRLQRAAGHRVSVHCLHRRGVMGDRLVSEGVPVTVHGPGGSLAIIWRLYRAFRALRPHVVHCHNKSATVHAAVAARLTGARLVSTRHGMAAPPYRLRKELKFWIIAATLCDSVVAVCETARRNMLAGARRAARNVVTIRNGAYPAPAADTSPSASGRFMLVTVGRLVRAKNYPTLLEAVAHARASVPDIALRLVGDGPDRPVLEELAARHGVQDVVQFCGERDDVGTLLSDADVFVLSSLSEGLPISILEAMAAGLPTIVTDVGGMPEVVALSGAGVVVAAGDASALARAMVDLAARRHELKELGAKARACYREHFTPEKMAEQYQALYRTCLAPGISKT
jgi:glycosyltransferase involved in cell wall biosynthesis